MKLDFERISAITLGAVEVQEEDGIFSFYRFYKEEAEATDTAIAQCTAGIQLNFKTDATEIKLGVDIPQTDTPRSFFAVDVLCNDDFVGAIQNLADSDCIGDYANKQYQKGSFDALFKLPQGTNTIRIVLPHSAVCKITNLELVDATFVEPVKKQKKILAFGDSITQGYDALHPSKTYAMRLADSFDAELINKGIGGECFKAEIAKTAKPINADFITVAYGINDYTVFTQEEFRANCDGFISSLAEKFNNTPIYVITPIWCDLAGREYKFGDVCDVDRIITEVASPFNNINVIHGWDLVPHSSKYYGDLWLHPNDNGFEHYFKNLKKEIEK